MSSDELISLKFFCVYEVNGWMEKNHQILKQ